MKHSVKSFLFLFLSVISFNVYSLDYFVDETSWGYYPCATFPMNDVAAWFATRGGGYVQVYSTGTTNCYKSFCGTRHPTYTNSFLRTWQPYPSFTCIYDQSPCASGQVADYSTGTRVCTQICTEPEAHPCDFYDINGSDAMASKNIQCRLGLQWDSATCAYKHKDGCTTADGYSGPFGGYVEGGPGESDLGKLTCIHGCNYVFDEYNSETGALHSSITIQSCSSASIPPTGDYDDELIEDDDSAWEPDNDLNTGTNCGEFNGEYLCVDSIPNGTCVTTPGGSYVCVSPPSVAPDTPVPLTPDIRIRTPGPNPTDPGDDDYTDFYKKPPTGTVPTCPDGYTYTAGKCVKPPLVDGTCPTGSTLINGVCVYDKDLGGPFAGPGGSMGPGLGGPPAFSYLDTLNTFFDKVRNSPLLDFSPNCGGGSASCPALAILGTTTTIHCDLAENAVPMFSAFLWLVGGLVAIRAVFSA